MHETKARKKIESKIEREEESTSAQGDQTGVRDGKCCVHHVSVSPITLQAVVEIVDICFSLQYRKRFREEHNG